LASILFTVKNDWKWTRKIAIRVILAHAVARFNSNIVGERKRPSETVETSEKLVNNASVKLTNGLNM
jgi:hypothetical protein